jgi:hypothetical protein
LWQLEMAGTGPLTGQWCRVFHLNKTAGSANGPTTAGRQGGCLGFAPCGRHTKEILMRNLRDPSCPWWFRFSLAASCAKLTQHHPRDCRRTIAALMIKDKR